MVAIIIAAVNILFRSNAAAGFIVMTFEIIILLFALLRGKNSDYVAYYIIFVSNCMEFSELTQDTYFYNLKDVRIGGINLAALLLIPLLVVSILKPIRIGYLKENQPDLAKYGFGLIKINVVALIVGALLVLLNDNNIQGLSDNIFYMFIKEAYSLFWIPLVAVISFSQIITYDENNVYKVQNALHAVLFGCWVQLVLSVLLNIRGYYGGLTNTLLVSSVSMLFPLFFLITINSKDIFLRKTTFFVCISGTALLLAFNASGKMLIFSVLAIAIFYIQNFRKLSTKSIIISIALLVVIVIGVPIGLNYLINSNLLFKIKFDQALSLFNVFSGNWRSGMLASPRARLEEIIDVILELLRKPWLLITGKGYMGSITDLTGYFATMQTNGTFVSADEWRNGTYYNLHEIASNLLMFGVMGIVYSFGLIKTCIKRFVHNPWIIIGTLWFLFIFGYSFTLGVYGVYCLLYSLIIPQISSYDSDNYTSKNMYT